MLLLGVKSLFSTSQLAIIESLVPTLRSKGYKYYLVHTNSNTGYSSSQPDLYFYFSSDEITTTNGYGYTVSENSLKYTVRTQNYSSSPTANNSARIVVDKLNNNTNVTVTDYEHIFSNATITTNSLIIQPDVMRKGGYSDDYLQASGIIISVFLFVFCFFKFFGNNGGRWRPRR